jgi:hypothetical protein
MPYPGGVLFGAPMGLGWILLLLLDYKPNFVASLRRA